MAVTEKAPAESTSTPYVDFDEFIDYQLRKTRTGIHQTDLLSAGVVLLCLLSGYLLIFALFDQWIIPNGFSQGMRIGLGVVVAVLAAGWVGWKIIYPWLQSVNALYAARQIEQAHPELKGSLLTWVNLRQTGRDIPPAILSALEKRTAHEISHANVDEAVDRRWLMRASYVLLGLVVAICLYTLLSPKKMSTTLWRALLPVSSVSAATRTEIRNVTPGDTEVLAREQLDVTVELGGQIPQTVTLRFSTADRRFVNEPVRMQLADQETARFQGRLTGDSGKGLLSDVSYFVEAGDARSKMYQIRVNQPPSAEVFEVSYEYPQYTGLAPTTQPGSTIEAWEGTFVTVRARPNMPIQKATLYCSDMQTAVPGAEEYPMTVQDDLLTARWQLKFREDGTFARYYHIQVRNEREQKDSNPTINRIQIRPDLKPEITLIHPDKDLQLPANAKIPIAFAARDPDFLLRRVALKLQQNGELLPFPPPLFAAPPEIAEFKSIYRLDLSKFVLKAGDQLTLWMEAEDNFEPFGRRSKNISRTPQLTITVTAPVSPEQMKQTEQQQEQQLQEKIQEAAPENQPQQPLEQRDQSDSPNERRPEQGTPLSEPQPTPAQNADQQEHMPAQSDPNQPPLKGAGQPDSSKSPQQSAGNNSGQSGKNQPGQSQSGRNNPDEDESSSQQPGTQSGKMSDSSSQKNETSGESASDHPLQSGTSAEQQESPPNSASSENPSPIPRKDKAAEDQALQRLLEWNKEQEKKNASHKQEPSQDSQQQNSEQQNQSERTPQQQNHGQQNQPEQRTREKPSTPPSSSGSNQQPGQSSSSEQQSSSAGQQPPKSSDMEPGSEDQSQDRSKMENNPGPDPRQPFSDAQGENSASSGERANSTGEPSQSMQTSGTKSDSAASQGSSSSSQEKTTPARNGSPSGSGPSTSPGNMSNPSSGRGDQSASTAQKSAPPADQQKEASGTGDAPRNSGPTGTDDSTMSKKSGNFREETPSIPKSSGSAEREENSPQEKAMPGNGNAANNAQQQDPGASPNSGNNRSPNENPAAPGQERSPRKGAGTDDQKQTANESDPGREMSNRPGQPHGSGKETNNMVPPGPSKKTPKGEEQGGASSQPDSSRNQPQGIPSPGNQSEASPSGKKPDPASPEKEPMPVGKNVDGTPKGTGKASESASSEKPSNSNTPGQKRTEDGRLQNADSQPPGPNDAASQNSTSPNEPSSSGRDMPAGKDSQSAGPVNGTKPEASPGKPSSQGGKQTEGNQQGSQKGESASPGQGGPSGQGMRGESGSDSAPSGSETGESSTETPGNASGPLNRSPGSSTPGSQENADVHITPEQADLANKRKATELALKRLHSQMERGETPRELMEELGYTEQDLERFMQRLEQRLSDPGLDHSPEGEAARRQFDSILKGIDYDSAGQMRSGGNRERKASRSTGSGNRLAPPQYRPDSEAYKEKLSREGSGR